MKNILLILSILLIGTNVYSQERISRSEYIEVYYSMAQTEMRLYGIPASITLAQALLESDNGNSRLAIKANNHFGIKCHKDWKGPSIKENDDRRKECFRKYVHVDKSYRDHSLFLAERDRYKELFKLDIFDYKAWAKGLKRAGYATNPRYPQMLIKIIEDNRLQRFDNITADAFFKDSGKKKEIKRNRGISATDGVKLRNGVKYIVCDGSNYAVVAARHGITEWMLIKFNETSKTYIPRKGEVVFLQPKRNKSEHTEHLCSGEESLWEISSTYAVKVRKLSKYNHLQPENIPSAGTVIKLRK